MINLKSITSHTPIFLAGTNLSDKLDITKRSGLYLQYDPKDDMVVIWYNKQMCMLSAQGVIMTPLNLSDTKYKHPSFDVVIEKPQTSAGANPTIQAQVSGPTSHVFANEAGHTGLGARIK